MIIEIKIKTSLRHRIQVFYSALLSLWASSRPPISEIWTEYSFLEMLAQSTMRRGTSPQQEFSSANIHATTNLHCVNRNAQSPKLLSYQPVQGAFAQPWGLQCRHVTEPLRELIEDQTPRFRKYQVRALINMNINNFADKIFLARNLADWSELFGSSLCPTMTVLSRFWVPSTRTACVV